MIAAQTPTSNVDGRVLPEEVSAATLFAAIGNSGLAENGQALLVSIAPIRAALGPRWGPRRSQIYEVVERHFMKYLSPTDIWQQVGETNFLAATPGRSSVMAQALCYRALKDVLNHFLGEVQPQHLEVSRVSSLSADRVEICAFSPDELEQADFEAVPVSAPATGSASGAIPAPLAAVAAKAATASPLADLAAWPLRSADGQDLRVSFAVDPVLDLKAWAMAGHRIESRIMNLQSGLELNGEQRRKLLPRDFERIDLAALERGMSRLAGAEIPDRPKLIIQLSFASLSNGRARAALLARARELQDVLRQAAICELVDVESGVPVGRLTEVAAMVRGFFRSLWVQVQPRRDAVESALGAKVSGLSVRAADLGDDPIAIETGMQDFVGLLRGRKTLLTVTSLPTTDLLINAMEAGYSHATLRADRSVH